MLDRTAQLLSLLADQLTQLLLDACRDSAKTEPELREATGASHATLTARLVLLEAHGLVTKSRRAACGRGRRPNTWEPANHAVVRQFEAVADAFALETLQAMGKELDDQIRDRTRREITQATSTSPTKAEPETTSGHGSSA
jgi:predicted ArsR family transcriptional regulator